MIRYDTKKVLIADPMVLLDDFRGFYHLKQDQDEVKAVVTLEDSHIAIKASCACSNAVESETHGFIFIIRTDEKSAYVLNMKADQSDKTVTLDQERGFPAITIENHETSTYDGEKGFGVETKISFKEIGRSEGIKPGEFVEMNVIKYRAARQPHLFSSFPVRTSYYNDTGVDQIGQCVPMKHFHVSADIIRQARFNRIYAGNIEADLSHDIDATFEYVDFTHKKLVLKDRSPDEVKREWKLYWKGPDEKTVPVKDISVDFSDDTRSLTLCFSHPELISKGAYELHIVNRHFMVLSFDKDDLIQGAKKVQPLFLKNKSSEKIKTMKTDISPEARKLAEMIPDQVGMCWVGSPDNPHLWPYQLYGWNHEKPNEIILDKDGSVWPNGKTIENKRYIVKNDQGEEVEYPFYEDEKGKQYFLSAHIQYKQKEYVLKMLPDMAKTDPLGATYVLLKLTEAYEKYVPVYDHYWRNYPIEKKYGPPYPYVGGIWSWWFYMDLSVLAQAADALTAIKKTDALDILSAELGFDVYEKIVHDLFRPSVDFILSYKSYNSNMDYCIWLGLAAISVAIDEPDYMHEAYERMIDYAGSTSLFDGFFMETTLSYHVQSVNGILRVAERMKGYSDPEGYRSPLTGTRFDNLDPRSMFPIIDESLALPWKLSYPDGRFLPLQDTWANDRRNGVIDGGKEEEYEKSLLVPAAGVAKLSLGCGAKQSQLYLMFTTKYGHNHLDPLNIAFYAYGCELLPDIGYNYTKYRSWSASTLSHNTVTIDSSDAEFKHDSIHGGNVEVFAIADDTVQIVKACQNTVYETVEEYSRELWRIGTRRDASDAGYVIDIFRAAGGKRHEYSLNYDANHNAKIDVDSAMDTTEQPFIPADIPVIRPEKALDKGEAQGYYYAYIYPEGTKSIKTGTDGYRVVATSLSEQGEHLAGMVIHGFLHDKTQELLLCEVPSVRATRLYGVPKDTNDEADQYRMQKLITRRSGEQLQSLFLHVLEPFDACHPTQIQKVDILKGPKGGVDSGDVVLTVSYGDTKDYIIRLNESDSFSLEDLCIEGKRGFVREYKGKVTKMVLVGGTKLQKGDVTISGKGYAKGEIQSVMRKAKGAPYNAFVTADIIPFDIKGRTVIVRRPDGHTYGYMVEEVRNVDHLTHIVIANADPGFEIAPDGSSRMMFYPFTSFEGVYTFTVDDIVVYNR